MINIVFNNPRPQEVAIDWLLKHISSGHSRLRFPPPARFFDMNTAVASSPHTKLRIVSSPQ